MYLIFPKSLQSMADLFAVRYLWVVCNEDKCCVVTERGRHSRCLACLRLHVLRAYCNFESKQASSITLSGPRPNNKCTIIIICNAFFPRGGLSYIGCIGMCGAKGYGFLAVLVWNRISTSTILVWNRVWFVHSSLELGMFFRRSYFCIIWR